jgi:hypothetical protein
VIIDALVTEHQAELWRGIRALDRAMHRTSVHRERGVPDLEL